MDEKKCKCCKRSFKPKRPWAVYCCDNCRVSDYKGVKSKWQKIMEIYEDEKTAALLGYTIQKNSDG